jgi:molybdopterin-containing oxidoreductase family iron-sulfur binding subunit
MPSLKPTWRQDSDPAGESAGSESCRHIDLAEVRRRLQTAEGPRYWRSLEELADTEQFREMLHREFPEQASEWISPLSRRRFLMLMGASLSLMGLVGCTQAPPEKIVPYVKDPEGLVPGKPLYFATAMPLAGSVTGLLVESHMGRPTKIEGNPDHPASLGATDAFAQASILTMYDPDREQAVSYLGRIRTWDAALAACQAELNRLKAGKGKGLRILTEAISSPTLAEQLTEFLHHLPDARWHQHEPAVSDAVLQGTRLAFGQPVQPHYHFDKADVILALDADFLSCGPTHLHYVRDFSSRRNPAHAMNRLYVVESMFTNTGAMADHRLPVRAAEVDPIARALAAKLGVPGIEFKNALANKWLDAVAADLRFLDDDDQHKRPPGTTLVLAGEGQPPAVHALAHAMNAVLGNNGTTMVYTRPTALHPTDKPGTIEELAADMDRGAVEMLLILGGNPVFTTPADLNFAQRMDKVRLRVHLGLYSDETSQLCHWHLPEAHFLETWGDGRSFDGSATILQPLIAPLYGGRSAIEVLLGLSAEPQRTESARTAHEVVQTYWRKWYEGGKEPGGTFETFWKHALHQGVIIGAAKDFEPVTVSLRTDFARNLSSPASQGSDLEIVFRPDPTLFDGRFANNGWLQELPKPLTRLTWDNAACLSPNTARKLGIEKIKFGYHGGEHGEAYTDVVTLKYQGRELEMPVWILPGHADDSVTVFLGYGRTRAGKVGTGTGFNAYALRTSGKPWFDGGLTVTRTGKQHVLACTQGHHDMEGRALYRAGTLKEYTRDRHFVQNLDEHQEGHDHKEKKNGERHSLSLFPARDYSKSHKWGMVINLGACTGCGACVVACQAENNGPVVGKDQVTRGREMHWLRIDRYFEGDPFTEADKLRAVNQPVPCMQCENAPCEVVCPVAATVHSHDGLNDMVYNRCVGTRYCSNNCPYKVRRFNFLQYADFTTESLKLMRNPEVTVRSRGVMEKCTYCVQRIRAAEIEAEREQRDPVNGQDVAMIRDEEVLTACQAVCPAQAIVFGDLNGPDATGKNGTRSKVAELRSSDLNYSLLEGLQTSPRTTYLAAIRNPNPKLG